MLLVSFPRFVARRAHLTCAALVATAAALFAQTPSAADGFDPNVDGNVFVVVTQADGRLLVGGQFANFRTREGFSISRNNLARLNADGSLDESFNPNVNGPVRAIVIQPDGRIVIGGDFTAVGGGGGGGGLIEQSAPAARNRIARLNPDGTVDSLSVSIGGAPLPGGGTLQAQVHALLLQPDGSLVVGGNFASVQPGFLTVIFSRRNLFRLTPVGAIDANFDPSPNAVVLALAQHVDNKIVVGGGFTSFQPLSASQATTRNRIARLNANGSLDSEFNPNANNGVNSLAVQRDGKIVLGGFFTTLQPPNDEGPATRSHIARLNVDGTLDSEFFPNTNASVTTLALQPDGSIMLGGRFTAAWGRGSTTTTRNFAARFLPDGSLDAAFNPGFNGEVAAMAFQPDGKVVIGGYFTRAQPPGAATARVRNRLARINLDGSLDTDFQLDAGGRVLASVVQSDGRVVIAGSFTNVGGETHNYLARLNADGTVDSSYRPDLNGRVFTLAYEAASNKVIVGGAFTTISHARTGTDTRNHIVRLNPDGTPDSEFNPNIDGDVGAIVIQPDGRILVGGTFNSAHPLGLAERAIRSNLLRLNANGTLDTAFDPSPNGGISAIAVQSDGKIVLGGAFSVLTPNGAASPTQRQFIARINADGTLDTAFTPVPNGRVSTLAIQSDGKIIAGGGFTNVFIPGATEATARNFILRLNADGTIDTAYDPSPNGAVLTSVLQADGRLIIGGTFGFLQPNGATDATYRRYIARLNTDGTVENSFNLDLDEAPGNRVDSLRVLSDGRLLVGGSFTSLQPPGAATRIARANFIRLSANGSLDLAFNPGAAGSAAGQINAFAVQPDDKIIAVGSFSDLGGTKTTNIARFNPEGTADSTFSPALATDGTVNAVVLRMGAAVTNTQVGGFAWLNRDGSLRTAFSSSANARISGTVNAVAVQSNGSVILGGAFANLSNATGGNLVRLTSTGALDTAFDPSPNGAVTGIVLQPDGKIIIVGSFTLVNFVARNNIARLNADGSLDTGFDPNANGRINAIVLEGDGRMIVGGAFTTLTPNGAATAVTRNNIARINANGTVDAYDPSLNSAVYALALYPDGKVIAGGAFTAVQPNGGATAFSRNFLARLNTDGTLDQNFNPNPNNAVFALVAQPNSQILAGGAFTALQPGATGNSITRNFIARINSDGAIDSNFNPNANGSITTIALQPDNGILIGGTFSTLQPTNAAAAITRNRVARLNADGTLDVNFNPNLTGAITSVAARPDGTVLITGSFSGIQTNGPIVVGGSFATIGGIALRNLATLNDDGSVNSTFQPRPDGAVNALLTQPDGKIVVGGEFMNIAGAARSRIARFNADGTLDAAFNPSTQLAVIALALQPDGRILVGGRAPTAPGGEVALFRLNADGSRDTSFNANPGNVVTFLAVQSDGRILAGAGRQLRRFNANGSDDTTFASVQTPTGVIDSITLQTDGRIIVAGRFDQIASTAIAQLARLNPNGTVDTSFNPAPNGGVLAVALQSDGRLVIGGNFTTVGGQTRIAIARLAATGTATQLLGVSADRRTVTWVRSGTAGEVAAVLFEISTDRVTWTQLGTGSRVAGTSNWQLTGQSLPASGAFYVRARAIVPTTAGTSSGLYETVREFNYSNPLGGPMVFATIANGTNSDPVAAAPGLPPVDYFTGMPYAGSYTVRDSGGATVEFIVASSLPAGTGSSRLANLSTRGRVTASSPLVVGFAISGTTSRPVLVRGVGPTLTTFGVTGALSATRLEIVDTNGRTIVTNEGWDGSAALSAAFAQTGAFPVPQRSGDSAAIITLEPGTYTLHVSATSTSAAGVALAEVYDAGGDAAGSRLLNVSTRANAAPGGDALISGFVISGNASKRVLLRGAGPSLAQFGVTGALTDPVLALFDGGGRELVTNDNWVSSASQLSTAAASVGAFALTSGSKDAAMLATLPPGAYTVQVTGAGATSGVALVEIYDVQ